MSGTYILVVEDLPDMNLLICTALRKDGYYVKPVYNGKEAWEILQREKPDLLVLDIMMPELDGLTLCRRLRADNRYSTMLILFLSAMNRTDEIVQGLDAGGDDYLPKPFEANELLARVRALRRRDVRQTPPAVVLEASNSVLSVGDLSLDSDAYQISTTEKAVQLTFTEHKLMRYIMERPNTILSPGLLLEDVWSYPPDTGDADLVRAHIRKLRAKIETDASNPIYIKTVHGAGYILRDKPGTYPEDELQGAVSTR